MNGSLGDSLVGECVVAFGGPFGTLSTDGGSVAFAEVRFQRGLIGERSRIAASVSFQKLLKAWRRSCSRITPLIRL